MVYGLLPRFLLALLSAAVVRGRRHALQPDWSEPYYRKLLARFAALAPAQVVDADAGHAHHEAPLDGPAVPLQEITVVIGFELPPDAPWPPPGLALDGAELLRIDGSATSRRAALDRLAQARPRTVVLACHAASSPDRGTERFLREVLALCGECRLWLGDGPAARWSDWLRGTRLPRVEIAAS